MRHHLRPSHPALRDLLLRLYEAASVDLRISGETFTVRPGRRVSWALDLRRPLLRPEFLRPAAAALCARLEAAGARQVAARGMGGAPLVCGIVAQGRGIAGLLARERPKERGFLRPFEGEADRGLPVWIVDDVVNSGASAERLAALLREEGCEVAGVLCLFRYAWGAGERRLHRLGLPLDALGSLHRRRDRTWAADRMAARLGLGV
jgi:orotate phosphoribosyltransferase